MTLEIILIDDDAANMDLIEKSLNISARPAKLRFRKYANTQECIEYIESEGYKAYEHTFLVDMNIKGDLDGSEFLFYFLKEHDPQCQFFYMTTHFGPDHDTYLKNKTGADVIVKTEINFDVLYRCIKEKLSYEIEIKSKKK